jgi:hypothetical protein
LQGAIVTNSQGGESTPEIGLGDRLIDRVHRGWREGHARIESWFEEARYIAPNTDAHLRIILRYVTELFDNTAHWNRFSQISQPEHIGERYLPNLTSAADQMRKIAEACGKQVCQERDLEPFLQTVRVRLDSRFHHWHAEALSYLRELEVAKFAEQGQRGEAPSRKG